jgi:hypothetical protein
MGMRLQPKGKGKIKPFRELLLRKHLPNTLRNKGLIRQKP